MAAHQKPPADPETTSRQNITSDVSEKFHCLVAPRRSKTAKMAGVAPMSAGSMKNVLTLLERSGCEIIKEMKPRAAFKTMSAVDEATSVYVARMDLDTAQMLAQSAPANLIVEEDAYLTYGTYAIPTQSFKSRVGMLRSTKGIKTQTIKFQIVGDDNQPIANAKLNLEGDGFPQEGETDKNGEVTLKLFSMQSGQARSLFVDPIKDYWTRYVTNPALSETNVNVVKLQSLKSSIVGFPQQFKRGWGQNIMGLDQLPDEFTGKGVKIAIIDSGADNTHPLLNHIKNGLDLTSESSPSTWNKDVVGHGSHCAGIITAGDSTQMALRGFAPEAEIFIYKVFPGGQFSSLLDALDHCIEEGIDVINMSLGSPQVSETIEQKLEEVVDNGIACIVAAGNSGGPVQYPAQSPNVLAVSAIGRLNEFPQKSWDTQTIVPGLIAPDGIFSPSFTCYGPQVGVCAPGVAIISTVPDNGFEPQSGTSMAAPHVTGLAALYLAHHPTFQGALKARNAQRVAGLYNLVKSYCVPYNFGAERSGAGLPHLNGLIQAISIARQGAAVTTTTAPSATATTQQIPAGIPPYNVGQIGAILGGLIGSALTNPMGGGAPQQTLGSYAPFQAGPSSTAQLQAAQTLANQFQGALGNQQMGRWWYPWG